jgi:hypothetical protein
VASKPHLSLSVRSGMGEVGWVFTGVINRRGFIAKHWLFVFLILVGFAG